MADIDPNVPQETPDTPQDPYEAKALELGWRPKEEWDGPEEDFIDAKEFVRRKPLFERIESQSKAFKELKQAFDALKNHHSKVKEVEYERALKTLKEAKKQALVAGETEQYMQIEERIEDIETQKKEFDDSLKQIDVPAEPTLRPEFVSWQSQNPWYGKDKAMTAYADARGVELARAGHGPDAVLSQITKEIKQEFAHKFQNPNRNKPGAVESGSRRTSPNDSLSAVEAAMTDEQKRIMNRLIRSGALDKKTYLEQFKSSRGA